MSTIDEIEAATGVTGDSRFQALIVAAARGEADENDLRELGEMARARGMEIRKPRHITGGQVVRSLEGEIESMRELIDGEAEYARLEGQADPDALGRANAFAQETARLKRELETSREPELKRLRMEELGESGRQLRMGDIGRRNRELRQRFAPTPKAEPVSGIVVTNGFTPREVAFQT